MERLGDLEAFTIGLYLSCWDRWELRRTSKRLDFLTRMTARTFSKTLTVGYGPPGLSGAQFRTLRDKFSFQKLRHLDIAFRIAAFPFAEICHDDFEPQIGHLELRGLLEEMPHLRLAFRPHLSLTRRAANFYAQRLAEKLDGMPKWGDCDRWRFDAYFSNELGHPRVVLHSWWSGTPFPTTANAADWVESIEILGSQKTPVIGKYPRLREVQVDGEWPGLIDWLEKSETPLLRLVEVLDVFGRYAKAIIPDMSSWLHEDVTIIVPNNHPVLEQLIRVVEEKKGAAAHVFVAFF